ncbi:hypothetical protein MMYC01_207713 [Madurella mycetomatis]|uniref:Uncharacterized protein n=1 Tax=Madurella mycetomatis TaxID=100816 RepID=A0A175VTF7_9PEZI|nr:hypothetical protein MMYC01_207713 [Madurella mycetomatis]
MYSTNERGVRKQPAYGQAQTTPKHTASHHKHDILNKLDPRVDSTHDRQPMPSHQANNNNTNISEGTYGPHSSRLANALDPRVDSDLDNRARGTGAGAAGGPAAPPPNMMGAAASGAPGVGGGATYGPHSSRTANALDPRVDSSTGRSQQQHHYAPQQTGVGIGGRDGRD